MTLRLLTCGLGSSPGIDCRLLESGGGGRRCRFSCGGLIRFISRGGGGGATSSRSTSDNSSSCCRVSGREIKGGVTGSYIHFIFMQVCFIFT